MAELQGWLWFPGDCEIEFGFGVAAVPFPVDGTDMVRFVVKRIAHWGQRAEPKRGTLLGMTVSLGLIHWEDARAGQAYEQTGAGRRWRARRRTSPSSFSPSAGRRRRLKSWPKSWSFARK